MKQESCVSVWICYNYNQFSCSLLAFRYRFLNEKNSDLVCHWLCASAFHSIPFRFDGIPWCVRPLPCTMWKLFALVANISHPFTHTHARTQPHSEGWKMLTWTVTCMSPERSVLTTYLWNEKKEELQKTAHMKFKVIDNVNKEKENVHNLQIDAEMKKCGKRDKRRNFEIPRRRTALHLSYRCIHCTITNTKWIRRHFVIII